MKKTLEEVIIEKLEGTRFRNNMYLEYKVHTFLGNLVREILKRLNIILFKYKSKHNGINQYVYII